mmetsp:Transcript_26373/g.99162  ORF Transcript_26373/g.99162 Transcript_26373/m.99162 type:complete len:317 (+) Transcript_26373:280-1230(+)
MVVPSRASNARTLPSLAHVTTAGSVGCHCSRTMEPSWRHAARTENVDMSHTRMVPSEAPVAASCRPSTGQKPTPSTEGTSISTGSAPSSSAPSSASASPWAGSDVPPAPLAAASAGAAEATASASAPSEAAPELPGMESSTDVSPARRREVAASTALARASSARADAFSRVAAAAERCLSTASTRPVAVLASLAVPSVPPAITSGLVGWQARETTGSPASNHPSPRMTVLHSPVAGAQTLSVPSSDAVMTFFPDVLNTPTVTAPSWPASTEMHSPVDALNTQAVQSADPHSKAGDLGCHAIHSMSSAGPSRTSGSG